MITIKLLKIQQELKVPKGQYNSFGEYKYRSCEDILEALKPILANVQATLRLSDEIVFIQDRYYIKSTATLYDLESEEKIENVAYAREDEEKKKMDGSQITGTASSYARKYCLNGLLLIDDTKDADTDEYQKQQNKETKKTKEVEKDYKNELISHCKENNIDMREIALKYQLKATSSNEKFKIAYEDILGEIKNERR